MKNKTNHFFSKTFKSQKGIALMTALFMVLLITFIVNEVNYETTVEYTVNSQAINRVKAYYAAKSGIEFARLRIRFYQQMKNSKMATDMGEQARLLDMIYQFPFMWPPSAIGDMSSVDIEAMNKIVKASAMDASYSMTIQTEDRININDLNSPVGYDETQPNNPNSQRMRIRKKLEDLFKSRIEQDDEWAKENRDFRYSEIINNIQDFLDPDTQSLNGGDESSYYDKLKNLDREADIKFPPNRWFRSVNELLIVPGVSDEVFKILEPVITVFGPYAVNPNNAEPSVIKTLHTSFTDEVVNKIIERRNNTKEGGPFNDADDFFKYANSVGARVSDEDQTKIPIDVKSSPCHFRINSIGSYGKVTVEINAITYEVKCQQSQIASAMTQTQNQNNDNGNNDSKNNSNDSNDKTNSTNSSNSTNQALPKTPPRIVYWSER